MATGSYGLSFLPGTQDNGNRNDPRRAGTRQAPIQEAIRILTLRQPKFYGSQAIAPQVLLTGPGGMGQPAARGNVTAQALAQMAGLPPTMAQSAPLAPVLTGGAGDRSRSADSYSGWARRERDLNRPSFGSAGDAPDPPPLPTSYPAPGSYPVPSVGYQYSGEGPSGPPPDRLPGDWRGGPVSDLPDSGFPVNPPYNPSPSPEPVNPKPVEFHSYGFGQGPYGGAEDLSDPNTWLSPFERQYGRYPDY